MKFCWTTLHVKDMEASLRFYRDIVGLPIGRRFSTPTGAEFAFLGSGETQIELICGNDGEQTNIGPGISIGFKAESLESIMKVLEKYGIPVDSGPVQPNPSLRFLFVLDPDGLQVQFIEFLS